MMITMMIVMILMTMMMMTVMMTMMIVMMTMMTVTMKFYADDYSIERCWGVPGSSTDHENPSLSFSHNHAGPDASCLSNETGGKLQIQIPDGIMFYYIYPCCP